MDTQDGDYTDPTCKPFVFQVINVDALPAVSFTALEDLCIEEGLQEDLGGGDPDTGEYSGPGVTDNGDGTYDFDPSVAGAGTHTISYEIMTEAAWSKLGDDILGQEFNENFGYSIDLSKDGSRFVAGAPEYTTTDRGRVFVYEWDGTSWTQMGQAIEGEGLRDNFGGAVAMSHDGNRIAAGATSNDGDTNNSFDNRGHVRVFDWDGTNWVQAGPDIDGIPNIGGQGEFSGRDVDLSGDGKRLVVGASANSAAGSFAGAFRVYEWNNTTQSWIQMGSDIVGDAASAQLGTAVAISADGSRVTATKSNGGVAQVYEWNAGTNNWDPVGTSISLPGGNGQSISLSGDGNRLAFGSYAFAALSSVFEYNSGSNSWNLLGASFPSNSFQEVVSISEDGNTMAIYDFQFIKSYTFDGSAWTQIGADITPTGSQKSNVLKNMAISPNGQRIGIGMNEPSFSNNRGLVNVFEFFPSCTNTASDEVEVIEPTVPVPDVTLATCDAPGQIAFTSTLGNNEAYYISIDGVNFTELETATIPLEQGPANPRTYYIKTVHETVLCESEVVSVEVEAVPDFRINGHPQNALSCVGDGISFFMSVSGGTEVSYQWYVNDGGGFSQIPDATSATLSLTDLELSQDGNIYKAIISADGCTFESEEASLSVVPAVEVSFSEPDDLCIDDGVQTGLGGGTPLGGVYSGPGVTDDSNGETYSFDPNAAGAGVHTLEYTYTNPGGWLQLGDNMTGTASLDRFGYGVAFSADGTRAVVGAISNSEFATDGGEVKVFDLVGGSWVQVGADINGTVLDETLGEVVAITPDGGRIAIGAPGFGPSAGHVEVFDWNGSSWVQVGSDILNTLGSGFGRGFGRSLSMSADGNRVAIGNPHSSGNYAEVFDWDGSAWQKVGNTLLYERPDDRFGTSVELSANGKILAVSASEANIGLTPRTGYVKVYELVAGTWTMIGQRLAGISGLSGNGDAFGWEMALSADGTRLAAGASGSEEIRVYDYDGTMWVQIGTPIPADILNMGKMDFSASGNRIAVADERTVKILDWNGTAWVMVESPISLPSFDSSIAMAGDGLSVLIGSISGFTDGVQTGFAQVFTLEASCPNTASVEVEVFEPTLPVTAVTLATCEAAGQIAFTSTLAQDEAYFVSTDGVSFSELTSSTIILLQGPTPGITYYIKTVNAVTGCESEVISEVIAEITEDDCSDPCEVSITSQPINATTCVGESASFSVAATGTGTLTYQWFGKPLGGSFSPLPSATGLSLNLAGLGIVANGNEYRVEVTSDNGTPNDDSDDCTVTSDAVTLTVEECNDECDDDTVAPELTVPDDATLECGCIVAGVVYGTHRESDAMGNKPLLGEIDRFTGEFTEIGVLVDKATGNRINMPGSLAISADGTLYAVTNSFSSFGRSLYKINACTAEAEFIGTYNSGSNSGIKGIAFDNAGRLIGLEWSGGGQDVFEFNLNDGSVTKLYDNAFDAKWYGGLEKDPNSNLMYVSSWTDGLIRSFDPATGTVSVVVATPVVNPTTASADLFFGDDGKLYLTTGRNDGSGPGVYEIDVVNGTSTKVSTFNLSNGRGVPGATSILSLPSVGGASSDIFAGVATATDNCDDDPEITFSDVVTPGDCPAEKTITRTWTATDASDNSVSDVQLITIVDTQAPKAPAAPAEVSVTCLEDVPVAVDLTATDNCQDPITVSPTEAMTPGVNPGEYTIVRTWTFTDDCGNSSSVSQTINVADPNDECEGTCEIAITTQPEDVTVCALEDVSFTVVATGTGSLSYTWQVSTDNGANWVDGIFPGASTPTASLFNVGTLLSGNQYRVIVISDNGTPNDQLDDCSETSTAVTLTVLSPTGPIYTVTPADCDNPGQISFNAPGPNEEIFASTDNGANYSSLGAGVTTYPLQQGPAAAMTVMFKIVNTVANCESNPATENIPEITCDPCPELNIEPVNMALCEDSYPFNLVVDVPGGSWSGPGITDEDAGTFDPFEAGAGSHKITYTYTDLQKDCEVSAETYVYVGECQLKCILYPYEQGEFSVWIQNVPGVPDDNYYFLGNANQGGVGYFHIKADGTARLTGTLVNRSDPNIRWKVDLRYHSSFNWEEWKALGGRYKVNNQVMTPGELALAHQEHVNWTYFMMDEEHSKFIGISGKVDGIVLKVMERSNKHRMQKGWAANDKDGDYGISGWFTWSGEFHGNYHSGYGDVNADIDCRKKPENDPPVNAITSISIGSEPISAPFEKSIGIEAGTTFGTTMEIDDREGSVSYSVEGLPDHVELVEKLVNGHVELALDWDVEDLDYGVHDISIITVDEEGEVSERELRVEVPDPNTFSSDFLYFELILGEDHTAQLAWETSAELAGTRFVLEHSGNNDIFTAFHEKAGAGNLKEGAVYTHDDTRVIRGRSFYRVKMILPSGEFKYSEVRVATVKEDLVPKLIIFPNPTVKFLEVRLPAEVDGNYSLKMVDISGREVFKQTYSLDAGLNSLQVDVSDLAEGVYMIFATGGDGYSDMGRFTKN